ncbi:MAG TPA: hypothetical protein VF846_02215, partial [Thermoanaerobaculia bacterium]
PSPRLRMTAGAPLLQTTPRMLATFFFVLATALPAQRLETTLKQKIATEHLFLEQKRTRRK